MGNKQAINRRRDTSALKRRFSLYKQGIPVYDRGRVIPYEDRDYDYARANELGYTPDETGHMPTRDYKTGAYLKSVTHPTLMKSIVSDLGEGYIPTYNKQDSHMYSHRFPDDLPVREESKMPEYADGKVAIGHNVSHAKINSDGTFTDDYTRTFEDMVVTPKRTELKRGSYSANNWNYAKAHRKDWMKTFLPEGVVNDKPLEMVYPEFDLLLGGRQIATSILKPKTINPKNAIKKTDSEWDAAYMKAVKNGNMEDVQRLRDLHFVAKSQGNKAVTKDGIPVKTYHTVGDGYNPEFTEFNPTIEGTHSSIYTSNDPLMSGTYSSKLVSDYEKQSLAESMRLNELKNIEEGRVPGALGEIRKALLQDPDRGKDWIIRNTWLNQEILPARQKQLYVNLTNPVQIDNYGRPWNSINLSDLQSDYPSVYKAIRPADFFGNSYSTRSLEAAQKATGYDGAIIKNVVDYGGSRKSTVLDWARANDVYMVNNPSKLKLADPITYDDAGNIIPLSKRDNFNIKDIRYGVIPLAFSGFAAQK